MTGREGKTEEPSINDPYIIYHLYETSLNCSLRSNEILGGSDKGEKQTMQRKNVFYNHGRIHEEYRTAKGD